MTLNGTRGHIHFLLTAYSTALALVLYRFPRLLNPVKGTNMSTLLSTPGRQMTIPLSYLDIGMGGYFEGFGGCEGSGSILNEFVTSKTITYTPQIFWENFVVFCHIAEPICRLKEKDRRKHRSH